MTLEEIIKESDRHVERRGFFNAYVKSLNNLTRLLNVDRLIEAVDVLYDAWQTDKPVLFCGNGGSGSTCSHMVNDLQKNVGLTHGKPVKALCLNDCSPLVSAWANDSAWSDVFAPQVATWGEPGAALVAVSGSGNSQNVLKAVQVACSIGMKTIGLSGFDGGRLAKEVDMSIHVPTDSMQQAEDVHMIILHMLFLGLMERIKAEVA